MIFNPASDECTTFKNIRLLKFEKEGLEIVVIQATETIILKGALK